MEHHLAKVGAAGSNPVSRFFAALFPVRFIHTVNRQCKRIYNMNPFYEPKFQIFHGISAFTILSMRAVSLPDTIQLNMAVRQIILIRQIHWSM